LPTGAPLLSDAVPLPITALQHLAISVYYKDSAMPPRIMPIWWWRPVINWRTSMAGARPLRGPAVVSQVEVARPQRGPVIVAFGDSITEGAASTPART
jgi:hypothetical protein